MALTKVTFSMIDGEVVNVQDYGATGDGVTDDTAAYLAAIATGKNVYFPEGTYRVAPVVAPTTDERISAAVLSSNQVIFGDGGASVIEWNTTVAPTTQTLMMITSGSNITVRDLRLTGASLAVQIKASVDGGVQNVTFENLVVDNMGIGLGIGEQIALNPSGSKYIKNVTVKNCKFDTVGVHGMVITNIYGFIVDGCYFNNIGYFPTSGGFCVDMSQGSRYGTLTNCIAENSRYFCKTESFTVAPATDANCLSHHISIVNNNVRNMVPQGSLESEIAVLCNHGASDITISGNLLDYPNTGSTIFISDTNPAALGPTHIIGNTLTTAKNGVTLFMDNASLNTNVVIQDNVMQTVSYGITSRHTNVLIEGNSIECSTMGVLIPTADLNINIIGNKIISDSQGIVLQAAANEVAIHANKITSTQAAVYSASGATNISVIGNTFKSGPGSFFDGGSGLVFSSNYVKTTSTVSFPSVGIANVTNAVISENTVNTNTANPNVSIQVAGTLTNVLVENNRTSRTVSVVAGTNVVTANNAFALGYTA